MGKEKPLQPIRSNGFKAMAEGKGIEPIQNHNSPTSVLKTAATNQAHNTLLVFA